ncbi:MAG: DUF4955 domain-containing protein [Gemmatimonadetes bacterium]|nr:DUF4955 domain-containing protein [Gemmatimonadota bacterium]
MRFKLIPARADKAIFTLMFLLTLSQLFFSVPCYGNDPIATSSPDFDESGAVDFADFLLFVSAFGTREGQEGYDAKYDLNGDGEIGFADFLIFASNFGEPKEIPQSATYQQFVKARENRTEPILPDFSYAGYHYFKKPVPNIAHPVFDVTTYGAMPNDDVSDQPAIVRAIAAAEANGRGIVFFPPGEFLVNTDTDNNEPIYIRSSNIVLRGSGSRTGGTVIRMVNYMPPNNPDVIWSVPRMFIFHPGGYDRPLTRITESADRETFWITVEDASRLEVGQWIKLTIKSTEAVNEFLTPYFPKSTWTSILNNGIDLQEKHSIAEIRGNRVRLNEPLHTNINHEHGWQVKYRPYLEEIGVEDISFHGMWFEKFVHFKNFIHNSGWGMLGLTRCFNSWVRRVSFVNCNRALGIDQGGAISIYQVTMAGNQGHTGIANSASYGMWVGLSEDPANHWHGPGSSARATGTVYWRYDMHPNQPIDAHASQPYANLLDRVNGGRLSGSGGAEGSMPNHLRHYVVWNFNHRSNRTHYDFWDINNKYGFLLQPIIVGFHGDPVTFNEDNLQILESNGSRVEPESLFEAQLELRMGTLPTWLNDLRTEWETLRNTPLPNATPTTRGTIPAQTLSIGTHRSVDIAEYFIDPDIFVDPDTPPMTYSVSSSNEGIATADVTGSIVTISPAAPGRATITATATDMRGLTTAQTVEAMVTQTETTVEKLYWTDTGTKKIQRADLDGSNIEDIVTTRLDGPSSIAIDATWGKIYWADRSNDKIFRANLDGTQIAEIINTREITEPSGNYRSASPYGIALNVDRGKMYWTDGVMDKIFRANLDGSNIEDIVNTRELVDPPLDPGATTPASIAIDATGGKVYWTDWERNKIFRANFDGSNAEDIITSGVNFSRGIALDLVNRKIYYTDTSSDKIRRANLDGTKKEDLVNTRVPEDTTPLDIALDIAGGKMYWTDNKTDKIFRANLDGTQVESLPIFGLENPVGIAVMITKY